MKKIFSSILMMASVTVNAQLPQSFIPVLQSYSEQYKLYHVPETASQGELITYKFSTDSTCKDDRCASLKIYFNQDENCVPQRVGLFGELPVKITHAQAMFFSPTIADNSSQSHDFMRLKTQHGCYELAMGQSGSAYTALVDLANRLAMSK